MAIEKWNLPLYGLYVAAWYAFGAYNYGWHNIAALLLLVAGLATLLITWLATDSAPSHRSSRSPFENGLATAFSVLCYFMPIVAALAVTVFCLFVGVGFGYDSESGNITFHFLSHPDAFRVAGHIMAVLVSVIVPGAYLKITGQWR